MVAPSTRKILTSGPAPGLQAATFLARTTGLTTKERNAYIRLINGLVADGMWSRFDWLYIYATGVQANANLNLVSTSHPITPTASPVFTPGVGYVGNGAGYLTNAFTPSVHGVNLQRNSATIGAYISNNRTSNANVAIMGSAVPGSFIYMVPLNASTIVYEMNSAAFPTASNASTQGLWINTRVLSTGAGAQNLYKNNSPTAIATASATSAALNNGSFIQLGLNNNGTPGSFCSDTLAASFACNGVTGAESAMLARRINDYMRALNVNVF
jgi:hypothetical protein